MMDLAEYIKQKTAQDIYKEVASKEYRRSSVQDRLEKIQNDRRHTRDRLLSSIRNITHLSPITPTPIKSRDLSKVSKKVANNNMREKLAKWRAEKERRKLDEKKKIRPVFKVSHVPDRIELPPPPPHIKSKFAPLNHVFAPPKNIKPVEITKPSRGFSKPVEKKVPGRDENSDKKKMLKTLSSLSKPVEKKLPSRDERNVNKKKIPQVNPNCLTEKIIPLAGQQKMKITKSVSNKENISKSIVPKHLQTANQTKDTAIQKNTFPKARHLASSSGNSNKKKLVSNMKESKSHPSISKVVLRQDRVNRDLKQDTNEVIICESRTDDDKGRDLVLPKHKNKFNMEKDEEKKEKTEIETKRHQSSSVSGSNEEIDLTSSPSEKAMITNIGNKNRVLLSVSSTDDNESASVEPRKRKNVGKTEQQGNKSMKRQRSAKYMFFKSKNESGDESPRPERKSKIVRFGSQDSVDADVFTPIKINNHAGVLKIDNEANIILSKPTSTKKYKTTPYKSWNEDDIFYSDEEICLKSPAVRKSQTHLKTPDKRATVGFSDFCLSTSDSGGSFQCVTKSRPRYISGTRGLFMSTSDSGTPGSIGGLKRESRTSVNSLESLENAIDSDSMPNEGRIGAPDIRGRSSLIPFDVEVDVLDLKASKSNDISESSATIISLKNRVSPSLQGLVSADSDTLYMKESKSNEISESLATRKSLKTSSSTQRISSVKSAALSDSDVLDSKTRKSNVIFQIPPTRKSFTIPLTESATSFVQNIAPSDLDTFDLKSNEISESSSTRKSFGTPSKKRRTSCAKSAALLDLDVLDCQTPKTSEMFESPAVVMSLRTRLKKRRTSSTQSLATSESDTLDMKNCQTSEVSATRKSLRKSGKKQGTSSKTAASSDSDILDSNSLKRNISESPANRKSVNRLLQKYIQSASPSDINTSDSDGNQAQAKSVTTTPDVKNARVSSSDIKTPEHKESAPSVYVSPFVTISRGKNGARKEYHVRSSTGGTLPGAEATTSPKAGAQYFDALLNNEIERIEAMCHEWNEYKASDIPEEAQNMIDVAVGQSKLLIAKKFNQFRRLIEQCKTGGVERTVTCQDLHGFWDMVFLQVHDVDKRFDNLKKLKENNWQEIISENKVVRTKTQRKTKIQASSKIKEMIDAARRKKVQEQGKPIIDLPVILAEGVKVDQSQPVLPSPRPSPRKSLTKPNSGVGRSLRASLLTNQLQQKRRNSSPGLVMMNLSQSIKSNDGLTPCKSILKNAQQSKSEKRITKTVLFKEDLEEERRF